LGFVDRLDFACCVKAPKDPILIQRDVNAVDMDLDAHHA
jgi:hypothetical protein